MRELLQSNPFLFWSFVFFIFFAVVSLFTTSFKRFFAGKVDGGKIPKELQPVFKALRACHYKNDRDYLNMLRDLAKKYPEEVEIFLMAGDVARKANPRKALEIHRDILFRSGTSGKLRGKVLKHVGEDHLLLGNISKALNTIKESLKIEDRDDTRELLSKAYELTGNTEEAYENMKKCLKMRNDTDPKPLKEILSKAVVKSIDKGDNDDILKWIKVLKGYVSKNESLLLSLKQSIAANRQRKAVSLLEDIVECAPDLEIAARGLISGAEWGVSANASVEGKYKKYFGINFKTNIFLCSQCLSRVNPAYPICPSCLSIAGKNICGFLEE